jgi:hypothetical protein
MGTMSLWLQPIGRAAGQAVHIQVKGGWLDHC